MATAEFWAVSVEGLAVPARQPLLKCLASRLGLTVLDECSRSSSEPLANLLHRVRAVAAARRQGATAALWPGTWLFDVPPAPGEARDLYRDLGRELVARLSPGSGGDARVRHLMLLLDADPHEAFEAMVDTEGHLCGASREVGLRDVCLAAGRVAEAAAEAEASSGDDAVLPFPVTVVKIACPRFTADNPLELAALCERACRECLNRTARAAP